jgi:hypothetical protein
MLRCRKSVMTTARRARTLRRDFWKRQAVIFVYPEETARELPWNFTPAATDCYCTCQFEFVCPLVVGRPLEWRNESNRTTGARRHGGTKKNPALRGVRRACGGQEINAPCIGP